MKARAVYVVDWDATCVEELPWPGPMGDWLPGAVEALRELSSRGKTVISSLRCRDYEMDDETLRPVGAADAERDRIRRKLSEAGLHEIEVYPNYRGKAPGRVYIDDRGVHFNGNWAEALEEVTRRGY